jgi:hypothetical protein
VAEADRPGSRAAAGQVRTADVSTALAAAPPAPASLTKPPTINELRAYVEGLDAWRGTLDRDLDGLDERAQRSRTPDVYSNDVSLAMTLRASIDARATDLVKVWDSGRVGNAELARAAELIWGRLPDGLGNPTAFSLAEACTLVSALFSRLDAQLSTDVLAGSGATDEIEALRDTLARAAASAEALHRRQADVADLVARLDHLLAAGTQTDIAPGVSEIAKAAYVLEALLIKEIALRADVTRDAAMAASTRSRLEADEAKVRAVAAEAREKMTVVPVLAIPSVDTVGEPPAVPAGDIDAEPGAWTAARGALDEYLARLARVDAALKEAGDRYGAGLARRADLRGLLGAYRDRAERAGLAEDDTLAKEYEAAHDVLYTAPCDIAVAERALASYQGKVILATKSPRNAGLKEER